MLYSTSRFCELAGFEFLIVSRLFRTRITRVILVTHECGHGQRKQDYTQLS